MDRRAKRQYQERVSQPVERPADPLPTRPDRRCPLAGRASDYEHDIRNGTCVYCGKSRAALGLGRS